MRGVGRTTGRILALVVIALVLAPTTASVGGQEPPPLFRASTARTGEVNGSAPYNNTTLWTFDTDDPVKSSPVVTDGRVYVGTMGGELLCLDAYTGTRVWSYPTGGPVESSPAVLDGRVYVGSDDLYVHCVDALTGLRVWRTATKGEVKSSPAVRDGLVYVGSNDFSVYCLDAGDGSQWWRFRTGGYVYSSPSLFDDVAYFGSCDGRMYAVNATTGEEVWNFTADYCPAAPAVTEDLVIFGAYDGLVHYLNRSDGRQVHSVALRFAEIYSSAGLFTYTDWAEEHDLPMVFLATTDGRMVGIGPDGEQFWNASHAVGITSSPLVVTEMERPYDPLVVYGDDGGRLHAVQVYDPYVGRLAVEEDFVEWHVKLGSSIQSSPFVWHDRVYVGVEKANGGGRVVCIGSIDPDNEPYVSLVKSQIAVGQVNIWFTVNNMDQDHVSVEFDGQFQEVDPAYQSNPDLYLAMFPATPPEGMKPVIIRVIVDDELALTYRGEVMCLVEGWDSVDIVVDRPKDGERGIEGILLASGTVSSNYTIQRLYARWNNEPATFNCTGAPNWTVALETSHLREGRNELEFTAYDGYRWGSVTLHVFIGEEEEEPAVEPIEFVPLVILIIIFIVLLRTKPPRVSEKPSDP